MKIVYQGKTKSEKEVIVRYPQINDVVEMLKFINNLSDEKTFVRYQGEHETLESESKYLRSRLESIESKKAVHLLVFFKNELVGAADVRMMDKTEKHVGILGIIVAKDFRGEGLGKQLMELVLKEAEKEIPDLKIIILEVYSTNDIAQGMYKEFGFSEYGSLPNGIIRNGEYEDAILMYKNIKEIN